MPGVLRRIFLDPCRRCGGAPFHKLGCPNLTSSLLMAAVLIGGALTIYTAAWLAGACGRPKIELGYPLVAAFLAVALWSRSRRSRFGA
jgi:hypothetical protein